MPRDPCCLGFVARSEHFDGDQFLCALAVACDLNCKILHHTHHGLSKNRLVGRLDSYARSAVGEQQHRVVRRRIAIHAQTVVALLHGGAQSLAKYGHAGGGVGHHETERGRHQRLDHAGALCHAGDAHRAVLQGDLGRRCLARGVGRHDRLGRVKKFPGGELPGERRQRIDDQRRIEFHADHACRGGQDAVHLDLERLCGGAAAFECDAVAAARGAVRIAGVHHHGRNQTAGRGQMFCATIARGRPARGSA